MAAKARALLRGRLNAALEDVRALAPSALRHRILLSFEGEAEIVARNIAAAIAGRPGEDRFNGYGECFIEVGGGKAGFGGGDFYAEPKPAIRLRMPGRRWHVGKVLVEKSWLYTRL